jgi:hypothetical protein
MMTRQSMKVQYKGTKKVYSLLIIAAAAGIIFSTFSMQVTAMAADGNNAKPVAVISGTLLVYVGHTVYMDGSLSSDPTGNPLNYRWKLVYSPQDSTAVLSGGSDEQASFSADKTGVYQVQLIVNNGFTDSKPVYANITVIRRPYMW